MKRLRITTKKWLTMLDRILVWPAVFCIRVYQKTLSPDKGILSLWLKGRVCMHEPHCSAYGVEVFKRYGFIRWLAKTMDRVTSCTGWDEKIYDPSVYRVVFFSSAAIGVPFLEALAGDARYDLVGVVTMPDAAQGRGMKVKPNVIKSASLESTRLLVEDIQTPKRIRPGKSAEGDVFYQWLQEKEPDFIVVIAYGKIIPQAILDLPKIAPINVHGSLLPEYRGASPIQSVFLDDKKETGVTIMRMVAELDAGPIIAQKAFPIQFHWTTKHIIEAMQQIGPKFLVKVLPEYVKGYYVDTEQEASQVTFCGKIEKSDGEVDVFADSLDDVYKKYRAYALWPKVSFKLKGSKGEKRFVVEKLVLDEEKFASHKQAPLCDGDLVLNPCVEEILVKPEGKKAMDWESFVNGYA